MQPCDWVQAVSPQPQPVDLQQEVRVSVMDETIPPYGI